MLEDQRMRSRVDYETHILCYKHIITERNIKPEPGPIDMVIQDISYNGLGVICNRDLGMGDFLLFDLECMGIVKEMMMEVRWCKYHDGDYIAGLQFMNLTKESVLFLDDLIRGHLGTAHRSIESTYINET